MCNIMPLHSMLRFLFAQSIGKWLRYAENQAQWVTEKSFDIEEAGIVTLILIAAWKGKKCASSSRSLSMEEASLSIAA